ncbi:MAG: DUF1439 domain-containing protein [Bdellovibrionales bacterium]|nr:DUF1439 domain-containing protein [Bdellovibrionales bacterium]
MGALLVGTLIAAIFIVLITIIAGLIQASFIAGVMTSLIALLALVPPDRVAETIENLNCHEMTKSSLDFAAADNVRTNRIKSLISGKIPTVSYYDSTADSPKIPLIEGAIQDTQVLIVDINTISETNSVIENKGPIVVFSSDPQNSPTHSIRVQSESLISFCQQDLSDGQISLSSPLLILDHREGSFPVASEGKVNFSWGTVEAQQDLGIYTFGQIQDVIREVLVNKKVDSLVDIRPGILIEGESQVAESGALASEAPEFTAEGKAPTEPEEFQAQYTKDCNWIGTCKITISEEEIQSTVSSLFASKGGAFETTVEKSFIGLGSAEIAVVATNPVVEFVDVNGVEKLRTTVDLELSTDNNLIQNRILEGQSFRAVVDSSLIYDDNTWRFYAHEPEVVDVLFSNPNRLVKTLRQPLLMVINSVAAEALARVPVFDLDKSSKTGTDIVGYLLDSVEIEDQQLVIDLSVF